METGILIKFVTLTLPPCAILKNVVNNTITNISSHEAPASIICGMAFLVPYLFSIRLTILGTTTAGDTAASTAPITAASTRLTPSIKGAHTIYPISSKVAGTNDKSTAGLPAFLRSLKSSESPAFISMIISAILRSSEDMDNIDGSSISRTYGPSTIPVASIPIIRGSLSLWHIAPIASPTRKINDSDVNIFFPPYCTRNHRTRHW